MTDWYKTARENILDCDDCGKTTLHQLYMLEDRVWDSIADKNTNLCIDCCEKRLGRKLVPSDFTATDLNFWEGMRKLKTPQLIERLGL